MEKNLELAKSFRSEFVILTQEEFSALMETLFLTDSIETDVLDKTFMYKGIAFRIIYEEDELNIQII